MIEPRVPQNPEYRSEEWMRYWIYPENSNQVIKFGWGGVGLDYDAAMKNSESFAWLQSVGNAEQK